MVKRKIVISLVSILYLILSSVNAFAVSDAEKTFLAMYFKEDELVMLSATRSLKSITRIAENVEIVTKDDIELMNAHTVAEALYNVVGIRMSIFTGPGNQGLVTIQGSGATRVALFIDGMPMQNFTNQFSSGIIPVQMIEKIEVIKGPASATWGSSFGGIVNIITKSVNPGERTGGTAYISAGERKTTDARAEIYGSSKSAGLYLYGGTMNSSGIVLGNGFWQNDFFTKLNVDAGAGTKIDASFMYRNGNRRDFNGLPFGFDEYDNVIQENYLGRVSLRTPLSSAIDLSASGWFQRFTNTADINVASTGENLFLGSDRQADYGFSANLTCRAGIQTIVAGTDAREGRFKGDIYPSGTHTLSKYAFYVNDTISLKDFSFTPGIRFDHSNRGGESVSPSIGMTYQPSRDILLKASVSRGFFDPAISDFLVNNNTFVANSNLGPEHIWSYQLGVEANVADFFLTKLVIFRHDISDLIAEKSIDDPLQPDLNTLINAGKARINGGEFSVKTKGYKGLTLEAGISYENIKKLNFSDEREFDTTNMYDIKASASYNDDKGLRAILKSRYLWWNLPAFWEARYDGVVTDFNIIKDIYKKQDLTVDIFLSGHNIFNGKSFDNNFYPNPRRWFEAGLRCKF
ncbi:MAG: TonB-dependent receptor plug domain-containing protein [Thermodesulfovibrionales bacterium]